ncbi:MAG: hypothetical protein EA408_00380 [Marinilabiliales bacterium]|nr:MAG: hypothetical protein EA408_00380 [Marinilabiliales bacterium]
MKIALIILGLVVVIVAALFIYYGGLRRVDFNIEKQGGETLVYVEQTGDYSKSAGPIDKIYYSLLNEEGVETFRGFGIYYDNPQKVEKSRLRSEVGNILEDPDPAILKKLEGKYNIKTLPEKEYIVTEFPYRGKLSVMMGIMKVYPAMNRFVREKGFNEDGWVMEIYDIPGKKIVYRKEVVNK